MSEQSEKPKTRVLFVCVHNSARSQMAEAFLNHLGGGLFEAESAGLEPGVLNPLAIEVMNEVGIDISGNRTDSVFAFYKQDRRYRYVIAVCDEAAEQCPIFPAFAETIHWSFKDPASLEGTDEEKRKEAAKIRDLIRKKVEEFIESHS